MIWGHYMADYVPGLGVSVTSDAEPGRAYAMNVTDSGAEFIASRISAGGWRCYTRHDGIAQSAFQNGQREIYP